ncbi:MAG: TIR domain-containing protein [bacterium]|nr:TIR domain-containing protein [bacterium]
MYNQPTDTTKHKIFVSFHHEDQQYRTAFDQLYGEHFISTSVDFGDIEPESDEEYIKKLIQQEYIVNSSVVFALYGANTYKRKHVDWEISAALNEKVGGHKGLVVLLLPSFLASPYNSLGQYDLSLISEYLHPRTATHLQNGYADLYYWPGMYQTLPAVPIPNIIQQAITKRENLSHLIDNARHLQYRQNLP